MPPSQRNIIAIDPSLKNLGYAMMAPDGKLLRAGILQQLVQSGRKTTDIDYHVRALCMAEAITRLVELDSHEGAVPGIDLVLEVPDNWFGPKGVTSKDSGAVQTLYFTTGVMVGLFWRCTRIESLHIVLPSPWKGQTPKDAMKRRSFKYAAAQAVNLPEKTPHDTHEAILLAKFALEHRTLDVERDRWGFSDPLTCIFFRGDLTPSVTAHEDFIDDPDDTNIDDGGPKEPGTDSFPESDLLQPGDEGGSGGSGEHEGPA